MSHVNRQHNRFYAVLNVPVDVQGFFGKKRFKQSLKTDNKLQAQRIATGVIAQWKTDIANARGEDAIAAEAAVYRDMMRKAAGDPKQMGDLDMAAESVFERIVWSGVPVSEKNNIGNPEQLYEASETMEEAYRFRDLVHGNKTALNEYVETWLDEKPNIKGKTKDDHRRAMRDLGKVFKHVEDVTRVSASQFVRERLKPNIKPATINRRLSAYKLYWDWLVDRGHLNDDKKNPWERQSVPVVGDKDVRIRRPFTEQEAQLYLTEVRRHSNRYPDDYALCLLQSVTGMRLEEVASLRVEDIKLKENVIWIHIRGGKNRNAKRRIPVISPEVGGEVRKRMSGEYVFEALGKVGKYGRRSHEVSRRLNRRLDSVNPDPSLVANHSWRHRAQTLLEQGGVRRETIDYIIGHTRLGEGAGRYSEGPSDDQLVKATEVIAAVETG